MAQPARSSTTPASASETSFEQRWPAARCCPSSPPASPSTHDCCRCGGVVDPHDRARGRVRLRIALQPPLPRALRAQPARGAGLRLLLPPRRLLRAVARRPRTSGGPSPGPPHGAPKHSRRTAASCVRSVFCGIPDGGAPEAGGENGLGKIPCGDPGSRFAAPVDGTGDRRTNRRHRVGVRDPTRPRYDVEYADVGTRKDLRRELA